MILGLIASAGGGVEKRLRPELAEPAAERGWTLAVTVTPTAARWLAATGELARLQALTELPVRSEPRIPGQPKPYPMPDAFIFAPATANSMAKLALGIADSQALTAACEALGARRPMVVRPQADAAQRNHPAFAGHVQVLRAADVIVSDEPHDQPWQPMLDLLAGP